MLGSKYEYSTDAACSKSARSFDFAGMQSVDFEDAYSATRYLEIALDSKMRKESTSSAGILPKG